MGNEQILKLDSFAYNCEKVSVLQFGRIFWIIHGKEFYFKKVSMRAGRSFSFFAASTTDVPCVTGDIPASMTPADLPKERH
jgi:hypothetical protein